MRPPLYFIFEKAAEKRCRYETAESYIIRPNTLFDDEFLADTATKRAFVHCASMVMYALFVLSGIAAILFKLLVSPDSNGWYIFCGTGAAISLTIERYLFVRFLTKKLDGANNSRNLRTR